MASKTASPENEKIYSNTKIRDNGELQESRERQLSQLDPYSDRVSTILVWKHLIVSSGMNKDAMIYNKIKTCGRYTHKPKILLNDVSGAITGGLWAVMGPSGSGKSTLLNTLACRLDADTVVEGEMRLDGAKYDNAELKRIAGYVMQDDMLNGLLTVEETLMYTAELRLPRDYTQEQRKQRVEETMIEMGVTHVRDVIIGTPLKKGISGGERKRVCVGMSLLSRPQLLFLDEPTSGLDSVTALDLLHTFSKLAHGGREGQKAVTIVCSIHQPQSKIFDLFDSIILLKAGNIIYQGLRADVMSTFTEAGFPCPMFTNPADHLMDVITPSKYNKTLSNQHAIAETYDQHAKNQAILDAKNAGDNADQVIVATQKPVVVDLEMGAEKHAAHMNIVRPRWIKQVLILIRRNLQEHRRESSVMITSFIQTILMAVLIGTAFLNIGEGQASIVRRQPVLFFCAVNQGVFGALMLVLTLFQK
uniref:ABC transporter domain-containing protein n=1 Tax=Panagrolaimus davidi TaxID=227884 RepID=A0A914PBH5_9BILA